MNSISNQFYVIAHEPGAEHHAIPTWASHGDNPARLTEEYRGAITRRDIDEVPGAFQLLNLLSDDECARLVELSENHGYVGDAAVSLPRSIRHNDSFTWVADDTTNAIIWRRCADLMQDDDPYNAGKQALGLNARYRFYRYGPGDYFAPHTDGSWPGSRVIEGELVGNAYPDRWSQLSCLLFLSDDYRGGETRFFTSRTDPSRPAQRPDDANQVDVRTPLGAALCFPHGTHPRHCLHASAPIESGTKYIIRSDVLFDL